MPRRNRSPWLFRVVLLLWGLQGGWLVWHYAPDAADLAGRLSQGAWGQAVRQEDPFCRWLAEVSRALPPQAVYLFLDDYEAGKEIEARYHLYPRHHHLISLETPPSFLFYWLRRENATGLVIRRYRDHALGPGLGAALQTPALKLLSLSDHGLIFQVDPTRLQGAFYD